MVLYGGSAYCWLLRKMKKNGKMKNEISGWVQVEWRLAISRRNFAPSGCEFSTPWKFAPSSKFRLKFPNSGISEISPKWKSGRWAGTLQEGPGGSRVLQIWRTLDSPVRSHPVPVERHDSVRRRHVHRRQRQVLQDGIVRGLHGMILVMPDLQPQYTMR